MHIVPVGKAWRLLFVLAVLELLIALPWHGIYLFPFQHPQVWLSGGVRSIAFSSLQILFIFLPVMAVIACWHRNMVGPICVALWLLLAIAFGVSVVPVSTFLAPTPGQFRLIVVSVINISAFVFTVHWTIAALRQEKANA